MNPIMATINLDQYQNNNNSSAKIKLNDASSTK